MPALEPLDRPEDIPVRVTLFNWVTMLMATGWVGIVTVALALAGSRNMTAVPTLEAFLKTLL
ncbi:MAG: hypothetical protein O3C68_07800 [Proteobacteria bacterium]|nr:hypothetical protein [Pseudomonadota bacterium]